MKHRHSTAGTSCAASTIAGSGTPGSVRQYDSGCNRTLAHARATTSRAQITAVSKLEAAKAAYDLAKDDEEVLSARLCSSLCIRRGTRMHSRGHYPTHAR